MNKKVEEILASWKNKYGENNSNYSEKRIAEIATNCVSLSSVWFEKVNNLKGVSFALDLFNKDGIVCETLHGITKSNLPEAMLDILVNKNKNYTKMSLSYFLYDGNAKIHDIIGELEIS